MTKIINILNNGNTMGAKVGVVNVNAANVSPDTIIAGATGSPTLISLDELNLYDWFNVDQTSDDGDEIDLPDAAPVGTSFTLYCLDVVELRTETDTIEINGVASKGYTTTALDTIFVIKNSGGWIMWKILETDGAVTSIVPTTS